MLEVEIIGQNAFGMCDNLEGVVIPASVTNIGPNAFRLTNATLYANKSEEETSSWNNWLANHDGDVIYGGNFIATSSVKQNGQTIGYNIRSVTVNAPSKILLLDYFNPDSPDNPYDFENEENMLLPGSLPIYAIYSKAFAKANLNAVGIGQLSIHDIRIESFAFAKGDDTNSDYEYNINSIHFGNNVYFADLDFDENWNEVEAPAQSIFLDSTVEEIILPNTMDTICESMFLNCTSLDILVFIGSAPNILPSYITTIGKEAFKGCGLPKLTIQATDATVGWNVFAGWADKKVKVQFYEDQDPLNGWDPQWYGGNGTPLYTEPPPADSYNITYYMKVGVDKWYRGLSTYKPENGATLANFSPACTYYSGWKDNVNFNGTTYTSIPVGTTEDKTYYAEMPPREYTLNFYMNDSHYQTVTYTVFDSVSLRAPIFYTNFSGWRLNSIYGTIYTALPQFAYGDYSFYATGTYDDPFPGYPGYPGNPDLPGMPPPGIIIPPHSNSTCWRNVEL